MADSEILTMLSKFRAALLRQDEAALQSVIDAYRLVYDRMGGRIEALIKAIELAVVRCQFLVIKCALI